MTADGEDLARRAAELHRAAKFYPADDDAGTHPAVEVAGVLVIVSVDEVTGVLQVYIDTEDSTLASGEDGVPYAVVSVNDGAVWINAPDHCQTCGSSPGEIHSPICP